MFGFFYSLYVGFSKLTGLFKEGVERQEGIRNNANKEIGFYTDSHGNRHWIKGNDPVGFTIDLNGDRWYTNARTAQLVYNISEAERKALDSSLRTVMMGPKWVKFEEEQRIKRGEVPCGQKYYQKRGSGVYVERQFSDYYTGKYHVKEDFLNEVSLQWFEGYMDAKIGYVVRPTDHYMFLNKLWKDNGKVYDTDEDIANKVAAANRFLDALRRKIDKDEHLHYYDDSGTRKGTEMYWDDYWYSLGKIERLSEEFHISESMVNSRPNRKDV